MLLIRAQSESAMLFSKDCVLTPLPALGICLSIPSEWDGEERVQQDNGVAASAAGLSPEVEPTSGLDGSATSIPNAVPEYPFWEASEIEAAWGADASHYVDRREAGAISRALRTESNIFSQLFFNGGSLAQHGLQWREGIPRDKAMLTLRALMGSFNPPHESKEATVALALHHWCEPIAADQVGS